MGIEPMFFSWKENVLPLDNLQNLYSLLNVPYLVEPVGVEPTIVHVAALPIAYSPILDFLVAGAGFMTPRLSGKI